MALRIKPVGLICVSHIMTRIDDLATRVAHVRAYANALVSGMWIMDQRRHMLKPILDDSDIREALKGKFDNTYGANAYRHFVPLLAQDLLRDLSRLYLDLDPRAGSFLNVIRKAAVPDLLDVLREDFRTIPDRQERHHEYGEEFTVDDIDRIEAESLGKERAVYLKSFDEGWATVKRAAEALDSDPVAKKIKTFRDENHAHLEMQPIGADPGPFQVSELGIKFSDIFAFADKYEPALLELTRVVTRGTYSVKNFHEAHQKYGNEMWRILSGLKTGNG